MEHQFFLNDKPPLCDKFPVLFNICNHHDCTVRDCLAADESTFFRGWSLDLHQQWEGVKNEVRNLRTLGDGNKVYWARNFFLQQIQIIQLYERFRRKREREKERVVH